MDRSSVQTAEFNLQRAQTGAYYASKHAAEHPGSPDAQKALQAALARCEEATEALRQAEARDALYVDAARFSLT